MTKNIKITLILGTNRERNNSSKVAKIALEHLKSKKEFETIYVDCNEYINKVEEYKNIINESDGIIIISPEYNHSFPGILKTLLDSAKKEYFYKVASVIGVSSGSFGGSRVIEHLVPVLREVRMTTTRDSTYVTNVGEIDENTEKIEEIKNHLDGMLKEHLAYAKVLKYGRDNGMFEI